MPCVLWLQIWVKSTFHTICVVILSNIHTSYIQAAREVELVLGLRAQNKAAYSQLAAELRQTMPFEAYIYLCACLLVVSPANFFKRFQIEQQLLRHNSTKITSTMGVPQLFHKIQRRCSVLQHSLTLWYSCCSLNFCLKISIVSINYSSTSKQGGRRIQLRMFDLITEF